MDLNIANKPDVGHVSAAVVYRDESLGDSVGTMMGYVQGCMNSALSNFRSTTKGRTRKIENFQRQATLSFYSARRNVFGISLQPRRLNTQ